MQDTNNLDTRALSNALNSGAGRSLPSPSTGVQGGGKPRPYNYPGVFPLDILEDGMYIVPQGTRREYMAISIRLRILK